MFSQFSFLLDLLAFPVVLEYLLRLDPQNWFHFLLHFQFLLFLFLLLLLPLAPVHHEDEKNHGDTDVKKEDKSIKDSACIPSSFVIFLFPHVLFFPDWSGCFEES